MKYYFLKIPCLMVHVIVKLVVLFSMIKCYCKNWRNFKIIANFLLKIRARSVQLDCMDVNKGCSELRIMLCPWSFSSIPASKFQFGRINLQYILNGNVPTFTEWLTNTQSLFELALTLNFG